MSNTPHLLADEFPTQVVRLQMLQDANTHFARICKEYDEVNRAVHRAETRVDVMSEEDEQKLRRERARLKDEIARMLAG
ncbi:MAG: YdcH family protein [Gemmobacter sp.]|uniref:YdcH family protein n=1 Tax=Gemmobacter sp. TaxID=1898957 RepID=UPI00391A9CD3